MRVCGCAGAAAVPTRQPAVVVGRGAGRLCVVHSLDRQPKDDARGAGLVADHGKRGVVLVRVALLASGAVDPTVLGEAFLFVQAVFVGVLVELEWIGVCKIQPEPAWVSTPWLPHHHAVAAAFALELKCR